MLPKIASALARVLDPIKPIARPGESISTSRSSEGGDGGHGSLGYSGEEKEASSDTPAEDSGSPMGLSGSPAPAEGPLSPETPSLEEIREDEHNPYSEKTRKRGPSLPLQPGLTQVILEASSKRQEATSGPTANPVAGVTNYDVSLKEQKKASRLPKGSMLDKKVG